MFTERDLCSYINHGCQRLIHEITWAAPHPNALARGEGLKGTSLLRCPRARLCVAELGVRVNKLFYGDNLDVLREHIASDSADLVYLDPPFNSNANYNILFKSKTGDGSDAQIEAFEGTWHWNDKAEDAFDQVARSGNTKAFDLLRAMRDFLGENDMMASVTPSNLRRTRNAFRRH